jgi:hypothetical protein
MTDDYSMSELTVAIWGNRTRYAQCATFYYPAPMKTDPQSREYPNEMA